jgi:hypothetical protein
VTDFRMFSVTAVTSVMFVLSIIDSLHFKSIPCQLYISCHDVYTRPFSFSVSDYDNGTSHREDIWRLCRGTAFTNCVLTA